MAFKGMNPDEGREVGQAVTDAGQRIMEIIGDMTPVVNGVEWVGPDYDSYREDWNGLISGTLSTLVETLQEKGRLLNQHAEEQDETSNLG
ncbi:MAG: hypothetical protein GX960_02180 [Actinomycetales bacterium]|nr:hypothetical protein [Actinomycetales bacterium]